jgi:hypothetical protein
MAASSYYSTVQKAYIAYYGRPADTAGLTYWATRIDAAGGNISSIIQEFGNSAEAIALYGSLPTGAAVNALYLQLFGRTPDLAGYNFYVNNVTNGTYTLVDVAQRILDGASGDDATIIANKLTAATSFTNSIDTVAESVGYAGDAAAAAARTWLATVSSTTASLTSATANINGTLSNIEEIGGSSTAAVNLTTSIQTLEGTTSNDTFEANTMDGSSTLQPGDIINAGNGTDTLNIVAYGSGATGVTLNSVEKVNVRLMSAQSFDVSMWSGVTDLSITNTSSADAALTITNASLNTTFGVKDDNDLTVTYTDVSGSGDVAKLRLDTAGSTGDNSVVTFNGDLETLTITNSGTSFATVDASAETVTVVGAGNLTLTNADSVSGLSFAGFSGTSTTTISTATKLAFTGGAGNDTLILTGLASGDVLTGGDGTDVLISTFSTATDLIGVSGFETFKFTATESALNISASGATITTFELAGVSAAAFDFSASGIASNTVINLNAVKTDMSSLNLGYQSGATAVVVAKASGAASFVDASTISGASTVTISAAGASATQSFSGLSITNATSVSLAAGGSGTLDVNGLFTLTAATSLTATNSGVGSVTQDAAVVASGLTTISATNAGSSTTSLWVGKSGGFSLNSGTHSLVADAGIGDLELGSLTVGEGSVDTISLTVGNGGRLNSAGGFAYTATTSGTVSLNVTQGSSATATLGAVNAGASGTVSAYNVTVGVSGVFSAGNITTKTATGLSISGAIEASATVGNLAIGGSIGAITLSQAGSGSTIIGDIVAGAAIGNITVSGGDAATITVAAISADSVGNISGLVGSAGTLTFTTLVADSGTFGSITLQGGENSQITLGAVSGSDSASGTDTVGNITLLGSGDIDATKIYASASVGNLTVADGVSGTFTEIASKVVGNITISGDGFAITKVSGTTVGNIVLAGSANSITLAGDPTTVGTVTITGSGAQSVDFGSALTVGTINALGASGTTLTLSNVKNAVTVNLGTGTNTVIVGTGGATINATAATGTDKVYLAGSGNDGITLSNFELLSSASDSIYLQASAVGGFSLGFASALALGSAAGDTALTVALVTGSGTAFSLASGAGGANTDVFILATGSYTTLQGALSQLGTLVSATSANAATAGSDILVLWYDSLSDTSKLTLVNSTAGTYDKTFTSTFDGNTNTLVTFSGVDIRGVSGVSFTDKFISY